MTLRLLSSPPEQAVAVRALQQPPGCQLLRDPLSFIKTVERKNTYHELSQIKGMTNIEADRVRARYATCK